MRTTARRRFVMNGRDRIGVGIPDTAPGELVAAGIRPFGAGADVATVQHRQFAQSLRGDHRRVMRPVKRDDRAPHYSSGADGARHC